VNESPYHTDLVTVPGFSEPVRIECYGEHHMGAEHIEIVIPVPVRGVDRFYTTNGRAYFSTRFSELVVHDACLILCLDLARGTVRHSRPPLPWYIAQLSESEEGYHLELYDGSGGRRVLDIARSAANLPDGFGDIHGGVLPSAYMPFASNRNPS
jgi:hypothetical protein